MRLHLIFLFLIITAIPVLAGKPEGFAVVELYTSEGCSSCPPADQLLEELDRMERPGLFLLAFHVDYWDYLGWRDPFARREYAGRQRNHARALGEKVYTPQAIVNGNKVCVGSDRASLERHINHFLNTTRNRALELEARRETAGVEVSYAFGEPLPEGVVLNVAVVEEQTRSIVQRGENRGKTLTHANVVRAFKALKNAPPKDTVALPLPAEVKEASVIAWLQDRKTLRVLAARQVSIAPEKTR